MDGFPEIDILSLSNEGDASRATCKALVETCRQWGFVRLRNHGISRKLIQEAFDMQERLFGLSLESKMKAPHPPGFSPHRGYSKPGLEQSYTTSELDDAHGSSGLQRKAQDYRESYDVGSEQNIDQGNIWLPDDVLPGFKQFEMRLYWELEALVRRLLHAFVDGMDLADVDRRYLDIIHSGHNHQLRLLHYPAMDVAAAEESNTTRMSAHCDWGTFTLLLQDSIGGLELEDPRSKGSFLQAVPDGDTIILNVGDMFMRMTNEFLPSSLHRVAAPKAINGVLPDRYSIPFFACPDDECVIRTLDRFTGSLGGEKQKYEPIAFKDYAARITEFLHKDA